MFAMKNSITPFEKIPSDFERSDYSQSDKKAVLDFMRSIKPCAAGGKVCDCVTGVFQKLENVGYEIDGFIWSTQDIYHIDKYNASVVDFVVCPKIA